MKHLGGDAHGDELVELFRPEPLFLEVHALHFLGALVRERHSHTLAIRAFAGQVALPRAHRHALAHRRARRLRDRLRDC